jgi:hypothetical protein
MRETLRGIKIEENGNKRSPLKPFKCKHFTRMPNVAWDKAFTRKRKMKG